jgi:hypothetical protein
LEDIGIETGLIPVISMMAYNPSTGTFMGCPRIRYYLCVNYPALKGVGAFPAIMDNTCTTEIR